MENKPLEVRIASLELELTRMCNAVCKHCMRGEAENKKMSLEVLDKVFNGKNHMINEIYRLMLTGGEPFLNSEAFIYLLEYLKDYNIEVGEIDCITNGLIVNEKILDLLAWFYKAGCMVHVQTFKDQYHPRIPWKNKMILNKYKYYLCYPEYRERQDIINIGRAKNYNLGDPFLTNFTLKKFADLKDHLHLLRALKDDLLLESMYVTYDGRFGELSTDSTWEMIDQKYHYNLKDYSIFQDCSFDDNFLKAYLTRQYSSLGEEFNKYLQDEEINPDSLLDFIGVDVLRDYLITRDISKLRTLKNK